MGEAGSPGTWRARVPLGETVPKASVLSWRTTGTQANTDQGRGPCAKFRKRSWGQKPFVGDIATRGGRPGADVSLWLWMVTRDWKETPSTIDTDPVHADGQRQARSCGQAPGHGPCLYERWPSGQGLGSCAGTGEAVSEGG